MQVRYQTESDRRALMQVRIARAVVGSFIVIGVLGVIAATPTSPGSVDEMEPTNSFEPTSSRSAPPLAPEDAAALPVRQSRPPVQRGGSAADFQMDNAPLNVMQHG